MNMQEKNRFRTHKVWKDFRLKMRKERQYCEFCGRKLKKNFNLHHMYEDDYTNLDPMRFAALCSFCHDLIETVAIIKPDKIPSPEFIHTQSMIRHKFFKG